ncbi:hypothetical protein Cob_v007856 [Colletotrichum orbiculare MAFF 240422]|uniref:Uncharacterized protein n=1 Tax=Colletotrichum orbiculare (strain 104-T / ATCC 96160 / CBS 514.97 / LARS 414 / MAFF 240422) TaxID=1213857 RepID=A0A484FLC9_COLOR|nr:hypothetical protein Cob_v007856 [Colletotrichum orbiculare MAFF 240422]
MGDPGGFYDRLTQRHPAVRQVDVQRTNRDFRDGRPSPPQALAIHYLPYLAMQEPKQIDRSQRQVHTSSACFCCWLFPTT